MEIKVSKKKIALFHPWIKSKGGAEKVVLEILKSKKYDIDLYTWVYDKENTFKEFRNFKINIIAPKISKKLSRLHILRGLFLPIALFSKIPLEKYDFFLISTSGMAELITLRNCLKGKTYAYTHTILRDAYKEIVPWNLKYRYKNLLSKLIYLLAVKTYGVFERIAWKRIDYALFNSELSLERAQKHNLLRNKKFKVIYPPVDVKKFGGLKTKKEDYFLYVSRLNPPKRQDLLIKAWSKFVKENPKYKLILMGNIENKKYFEKLKRLANQTKNVEIKTNLNDEEFMHIYQNCLAGIYIPFMEDFGIVPFEILATGKPLIAVDKGGYVKLIEKSPQFHKIKELYLEKEMIDEINKCLKKFIKSKKDGKKIIIKDISTHNFINEFEEVFER